MTISAGCAASWGTWTISACLSRSLHAWPLPPLNLGTLHLMALLLHILACPRIRVSKATIPMCVQLGQRAPTHMRPGHKGFHTCRTQTSPRHILIYDWLARTRCPSGKAACQTPAQRKQCSDRLSRAGTISMSCLRARGSKDWATLTSDQRAQSFCERQLQAADRRSYRHWFPPSSATKSSCHGTIWSPSISCRKLSPLTQTTCRRSAWPSARQQKTSVRLHDPP